MTARAALEQAQSLGVRVVIDGDDLRLRGGREAVQQIVPVIREHKLEIIAELRKSHPDDSTAEPGSETAGFIGDDGPPYTLTQRGVICRECKRIGRAYPAGVGFVCPDCVEWRIAGCARFVVLADRDEAEIVERGCCLACGASAELHGSPSPAEWKRVASVDDVQLVEVRYVISVAVAIAKGARP